MQNWDIYEIGTELSSIHGIMLRGRIRKFALENSINLLTENASDVSNVVRFAVYSDSLKEDISRLIPFIKSLVPDSNVGLALGRVKNPVLSKLKVNKEERYSI